MKTVKNIHGDIIEVADNTPCLPGEDGGLPTVLDAVVHAHIFSQIEETNSEWEAGAADRALANVRLKRTPLLVEADFKINSLEDTGWDASLWRQYRQALRDITSQPDAFNLVWPTKP